MEFSRPEYGVSSKATAPYSSNFAWKIPWTEEPGGLQSMGSLESDTTERLHFHFSLSYIGEGYGNPLLCSCLENHRDGRVWWAVIYGVAQIQTRLKQLSSSRSSTSPQVTCFCRDQKFSHSITSLYKKAFIDHKAYTHS